MYNLREVIVVSKYEEIADVLRNRIKQEVYPPDSLLPNQVDLVKEFGVSRMTIKKAITILTMEGLIYSQRGLGTRVLNHPFIQKDTSVFTEYTGLSAEMKKNGREVISKIIEFKVEFPNEEVQEKMMLNDEQPVYNIVRLRVLDGQPYVLEHTFMPVHLVPELTRSIIEHSIYDYIKNQLGISFAGAYRTISADKSSDYDQKYLECAPTDPVLEVMQIVYQRDGRPIEFSKSRNRFDVRGYSYLDVQE